MNNIDWELKHILTFLKKNSSHFLGRGDKEIILYPFGKNGKAIYEVLKEQYGIIPAYIIDNVLCEYDTNIYSSSVLQELNLDNFCCILTTSDNNVTKKIIASLCDYGVPNKFLELFPKGWNWQEVVEYHRSLGARIGERCEIYGSVDFGSEPFLVSVGNHVRLCADVQFITHDGGTWVLRELYEKEAYSDKFGKIEIGNNVHVGMGSIIMPNVSIGDNCIIGCGAIVTRNIPNNSVAVGIPARVIESIDTYYDKNKNSLVYTKHLDRESKRKFLINAYGIEKAK